MQIFTAKHRTKPGEGNRKIGGRTVEAKGDCNPIGRTTMSTNLFTQNSEGQSHQRVHVEGSTALVTYVAQDCLIRHQWEGSPLVLGRLDTLA